MCIPEKFIRFVKELKKRLTKRRECGKITKLRAEENSKERETEIEAKKA